MPLLVKSSCTNSTLVFDVVLKSGELCQRDLFLGLDNFVISNIMIAKSKQNRHIGFRAIH